MHWNEDQINSDDVKCKVLLWYLSWIKVCTEELKGKIGKKDGILFLLSRYNVDAFQFSTLNCFFVLPWCWKMDRAFPWLIKRVVSTPFQILAIRICPHISIIYDGLLLKPYDSKHRHSHDNKRTKLFTCYINKRMFDQEEKALTLY